MYFSLILGSPVYHLACHYMTLKGVVFSFLFHFSLTEFSFEFALSMDVAARLGADNDVFLANKTLTVFVTEICLVAQHCCLQACCRS